jgi:hypothetical protein
MRRLVEDSHSGEEPDRSGGAMPAASELFKFKRLALSVGLSTDGNDSGPSRIRAVRIGLRQGNGVMLKSVAYDFIKICIVFKICQKP